MTESPFAFLLADVGEGLHEAEIRRWLVRPGDRVALDQPLVEIETDKAVVELPSPVAGTVARLGADEGSILHVGDLVALLEPEHSLAGRANAGPPRESNGVATPDTGSIIVHDAGADRPASQRPLATPAVRKRARELGVDLTRVTGTGPGGRIVAGDVESFARAPEASPHPGGEPSATKATAPSAGESPATPWTAPRPALIDSRQPLRGLRRRIAQTMAQSWSTIPHITGFDEVDVSALVLVRDRLKPLAEARGARLTYLPFIVKAVALALKDYPIVNASLDEAAGEIVLHAAINVGIATATPDGLVVPVLHGADELTLIEIQQRLDQLAERARVRTSTAAELHGGTFTITNFGALGGWQASPIIRPGESAILGVGRIQDRPWAVDGTVVVRPVLALSLAADHRLIDGDVSTSFLTRIGSLLSGP
ncbi:MAG: dihydrolipoamide acetyltransferase family protein, partial [Dehalococcoidia bacterium]